MGSTSRHGQAVINPAAPEALGICDRCGKLYNLRALFWQMGWRGTAVQNLHIRVCTTCNDIPNEQLRTLILPPDPPPVFDARTEPYEIDEKNFLTLAAIIGKPAMFIAHSEMLAQLDQARSIIAPFSDADAMTATLMLGVGLTASFSDACTMTADLDVASVPASRTVTDDFEFAASGTFTETGAAIGTAATDRLVVVAASAFNSTASDGFDSVTIGGVAATLAVEVIRANSGGFSFCSIYWRNVPTGTTANIAFVFTGDTVAAEIEVYRVVGADTVTPVTDTGTGSVASGNVSDSVTIGNNSVTISATQDGINAGAPGTTIWTNNTEDRDGGVDIGGAFVTASFASRADTTGPGATTITAAVTGESLDTNKTLAIAVLA